MLKQNTEIQTKLLADSKHLILSFSELCCAASLATDVSDTVDEIDGFSQKPSAACPCHA